MLLSLKVLCKIEILKRDIQLEHVSHNKYLKDLVKEKLSFYKSAVLANRLSGCMHRIMASYGSMKDAQSDQYILIYLAACNCCRLVELILTVKPIQENALAKCLVGSLVTNRPECLNMFLRIIVSTQLSPMKFVLNAMYRYHSFMPYFKRRSLALLSSVFNDKNLWVVHIEGMCLDNHCHACNAMLLVEDLAVMSPSVRSVQLVRLYALLVHVNAYQMIEWVAWMGVPIGVYFPIVCMIYDRFNMLNNGIIQLCVPLIDKWCIHWVFNFCSPLSVQWCLLNVPDTRRWLVDFNLCYATQAKLNLLKESYVWFGEDKAVEAAGQCSYKIFKQVIDMTRSWKPADCYKAAEFNHEYGARKLIKTYIMKKHGHCRGKGRTPIETGRIFHPERRLKRHMRCIGSSRVA